MWNATIQSVDKRDGSARIVVNYTNGTEKFQEEIFLTSPSHDTSYLQKRIRDRIASIQAIYTIADTLTAGSPIVPAAPENTTPTQDDVDRLTFFEDYRSLQGMQKAIEQGLKKPDDKDYIDLQGKLKTEFKPEYSSLIS